MPPETYLAGILEKYSARALTPYANHILELKRVVQNWSNTCFLQFLGSGSRAKGTAISLASDLDVLVSLKSTCNQNIGGLKSIYDGLYEQLQSTYKNVRKQNTSVRLNLYGLEVDVTPARIQPGQVNYHWIYLSKTGSRQQTNIQKHIADISSSRRIAEIKLIKIWRELNALDFPSVYLEYLLIKNVLLNKSTLTNAFVSNTWHAINEFAKDSNNPLFCRIVDPANSANVLSDLLSVVEKKVIIAKAKVSASQNYWENIVW